MNACQNHIRQLGLGMLLTEQSARIIPHNGGAKPDRDENGRILGSSITARDGSKVNVSITYNPDGYFPLGVGDPQQSPSLQTGSWCYSILPQIDEGGVFNNVDFRRAQPLFLCPTRGRKSAVIPIADELFSCESGNWEWSKTDYAARLQCRIPCKSAITITHRTIWSR